MKIISIPYTRSMPVRQRRLLIGILAICGLLVQVLLPSVTTGSVLGSVSLLILPVALYCHHALFSNAWVWNRLFQKSTQLDEYERHTRNAFVADAYTLNRVLVWISLAAFLWGGGLILSLPLVNVFAGATFEVAVLVFVGVLITLFEVTPKAIAAWREDVPDA